MPARDAGRCASTGKFVITMSGPEQSTIFETAAAVSSAVKAIAARRQAVGHIARSPPPRSRSPRSNSNEAYSPIVLAGIVRVIEVVLVAAVGLVLYLWYVAPVTGFARYYVGSIVGISLLSMLAFQAADIYQVQAFRGHEKQYMRLASAWSVVFLLAVSAVVLRRSRRRILPRLARQLLRGRPVHADRISARACSCWCAGGRVKAVSTAAPSWSAPATAARR